MKKSWLVLYTIVLITMSAAAEPTTLNPKSFSLSIDMTSLADAVTELDGVLASRRSTVGQLIEDANQTHPDVCNNTLAYKPLTNRSGSDVFGFCWNDEEEQAQYWFPQGVTTTHDAYGVGEYEGHQLVVTSWYHIPEKEAPDAPLKGVRITFTQWEDDLPKIYQHVLLVEPTDDGNFDIIPIHAGGIMWYGNLLYVAHTWHGFRIFDMDYLYEMDTDRADLIGKQTDGKFYAYGYKYVLVQTGRIRNTGSPLRYSFVSLDRATIPDSLIAGEYSLGTTKDNNTNVVRFSLDYTTRLPMESATAKIYATEAYETHIYQMQGALARDGRFWFSSSNGGGGPSERSYGRLRVWDRGTTEVRKYSWTYGSEDLAYWKNPDGSGRIWTVTEWPRWRTVVSIPEADWE